MQKLEKLFFFLLLVFLPSQLGLHFWPNWALPFGKRLDYFSPTVHFTDILIFLLCVVNLFNKIKKIKLEYFCVKWKLAYFFGVLILIYLNSLYSWNPHVTSFKWLKLLEFLWLFVYCKSVASKFPSFFFKGVIISLIYTSVLALGQFLKQSSLGGVWYFLGERSLNLSTFGVARAMIFDNLILRPYASFPHPNVLAGFLVLSVLTIAVWCPFIIKKRILTRIAVLLSLIALVLTGSKSANSALFVGVFILIFRTKAVVFIILLELILTALLFRNLFSFQEESFIVRQQLIYFSWDAFKSNVLFGTGFGTSPLYSLVNHLKTTNLTLSGQPVHNIFILLLSEVGIVGISGLFLMMIKFFRQRKILSLLLPILWISLLDHYFITLHQGMMAIAVFLGFSLGKARENSLKL